MQKSLRNIWLIILLILVLPISAFFIYQFASLNKSEKEINKIYIQQLETIIYSINQYSEDIVSGWANDLSFVFSASKFEKEQKIREFLNNKSSVKNVFYFDATSELKTFNRSFEQEKLLNEKIDSILINNKNEIEKLYTYLKSGYQKLEPLGRVSNSNLFLCIFPLKSKSNPKNIGGIIFNPNEFIQENLSSKILQAAGEEFILTVSENVNDTIIFSSERNNVEEIIIKKPLWLLPNYSLGIKMKSGSIQTLVSQRFYENLIILCFLLAILIIGIFLIIYNLKKQLLLTQLKSDFVTNVSHELRTPLALISMYSETLVMDRIKSDEKKKEYFSVIHNETNRLSKIVNSILNFAKMENQTRKFDFQKCRLVEISKEVLQTYDYHIKSKGFIYKVNYGENISDIYIDKDAISEAMINLIENTLKYSNDKKEFNISIDSNNKGPYWEIEDFGIGIGSADQKKIFEKFYRVSSGLVYNIKGTGIGLSLVKQIMDAHSGEIIVNSKLGIGSKFRLQFKQSFINN